MTIWELNANDGYNNAYLINEFGERIYEKGSFFKDLQTVLQVRNILIERFSKGFPDVMNYWGVSGSCIVSSKLKSLLEKEFADLSIQFFPCKCKQYPNVEMWILNVCEYHDVLDVKKSNCQLTNNFKEDWLIFENTHEPIVTQREFDLVQELRKNIRRPQRQEKANPFS